MSLQLYAYRNLVLKLTYDFFNLRLKPRILNPNSFFPIIIEFCYNVVLIHYVGFSYLILLLICKRVGLKRSIVFNLICFFSFEVIQFLRRVYFAPDDIFLNFFQIIRLGFLYFLVHLPIFLLYLEFNYLSHEFWRLTVEVENNLASWSSFYLAII